MEWKPNLHPNSPCVVPFQCLSVDPVSYQRWLPQFIMQLLVFPCCTFWHQILLIFLITFRLISLILRYLSLSFQNFYLSSIASISTFQQSFKIWGIRLQSSDGCCLLTTSLAPQMLVHSPEVQRYPDIYPGVGDFTCQFICLVLLSNKLVAEKNL